jgi:mycobactin lysine-N-oxygenase
MRKKLLVIGAGPKAAAIAAKAVALEVAGYKVPEIIILEKNEIGANWSGRYGYTNGDQLLGTSPYKDLGFPYYSVFDNKVTFNMIQNFSWQAFLSSEEKTVTHFGEWVDRSNPQPTHKDWYGYLIWAIQRAKNDNIRIINGTAKQIKLVDSKWKVNYSTISRDKSQDISVDGIVITGPGDANKIKNQPKHERILDGKSFWQNLYKFDRLYKFLSEENLEEPICVIGSGETAASIIAELVKRTDAKRPTPIQVINPQGMIFSRGENYFENSVYTDPEGMIIWRKLPKKNREEIVKRTDRGVFSTSSLETINNAQNVMPLYGRISRIEISDFDDALFAVAVNENKKEIFFPASYIVIAIGFNPWSFVNLFDPEYQMLFEENRRINCGKNNPSIREVVVDNIKDDLTISWSVVSPGLDDENHPKFHVPMLAGIAQGPGFPNLSCLGSLSDRILKSYLPPNSLSAL